MKKNKLKKIYIVSWNALSSITEIKYGKKFVKFWLNLHWLEKSADNNAQQISLSDLVLLNSNVRDNLSRTLILYTINKNCGHLVQCEPWIF